MIKTKGVVHFTIPVSDLARSEKFYTELLGFKFVRKNARMVFLQSGDDYFVLTYSENPIDPCSSSSAARAPAPSPAGAPISTIPTAT